MTEIAKCELCGEPMPEGEEMFKLHGYSGNCPRPPLKTPIQTYGIHGLIYAIISKDNGVEMSFETTQQAKDFLGEILKKERKP